MKPHILFQRSWLGLGWLAVALLSGCGTVGYTQLQKDFIDQVQQDNRTSASPFVSETDANEIVAEGYRQIAAKLTEDDIIKLDIRQQPNAWMMRAISLWRSGDYADARDASSKGLRLKPDPGSRESVILQMIPGLIVDAQMLEIWSALPIESMAPEAFEEANLQQNYKTAFEASLNPAREEAFEEGLTPNSVRTYLHYQRWRVLQNWDLAISKVSDSETRKRLRRDADAFLGDSLVTLMDREKAGIPEGNPYRQLIEAKTQF